MTNRRDESYYEAAKAWLSGMGYSDAQQAQIIDLSLKISFNNLSSQTLLNAAIAELVFQFSALNLNAKSA